MDFPADTFNIENKNKLFYSISLILLNDKHKYVHLSTVATDLVASYFVDHLRL